MGESVFSASWYRVADLKPRLRAHAQLHRHVYRGQIWYVLEDLSSERYHRFTPEARLVIGLMDGRRSVDEVWTEACAQLGEDAPTQDELIQLLSQLFFADALQSDVQPDARELFARYQRKRKMKIGGQLMSPLFWRIPLVDPERFLQRLLPYVRPLFTLWGALLWLAVVGTGATLALTHWEDLSESFIDRVLAPENLLVIWLVFPILKILHELGHGFATKAFGGEVHEMGIMLLILMPLPYVDASSASAFRKKRKRIVVGAAGMIVETFLASLAMLVWVNAEPGAVRTVAYNAVFIGGISTLLFNANPLLRFDGYYILGDLIEIPNLRQRSTRYLSYLGERFLLGNADAREPPATGGEKAWFLLYGSAAFVYRIFLVTGIILFIASKFFFVGIALALWSLIGWVFVPLVRGISGLLTGPRLRRVRARAVGGVSAALLLLVLATCVLPVPLNSRAEGVIWVPEKAIVRASTDGFVSQVVALPGSRVDVGDVLFHCRDPQLETEVRVLEARLAERRAAYDARRFVAPAEAGMILEEVTHLVERLATAREDLDALTVTSELAGTFVAPNSADYVGRFVRRGTPIARVIELGLLTARVVVGQSEVDLVRQRTSSVQVRLAERLASPLPAEVLREVPGGSEQLPTTALGLAGGGGIAVDPRDQRGTQALERLFQFDLALPGESGVVNVGGRVYVRFHHGWEPLAYRWTRQLRQLFMTRFQI